MDRASQPFMAQAVLQAPAPAFDSVTMTTAPRPTTQAKPDSRCQDWLDWALGQLGVSLSEDQLAELTQLIGSTVTGQGRLFHNTEHILRLAEGEDPISTLAALFHDSVYIQVDWGLTPNVQPLLTPYLTWQGGALCLRSAAELMHLPDSACPAMLFGLEHGQPLPAEKFNEFLSALLAVCCLKPHLSARQLAEVVVAIEASIPFRAKAQHVPSEQLFERLNRANQRFGLDLSSAQLEQAIHRAVAFANRDVGSFSGADPVIFLDQTWRLLPELSPALRDASQYSIQDYRKALRAMEAFLRQLRPEQIFQQFRQVPNSLTCRVWRDRAAHNLETALLYLGSKLVAIAVLEAIASWKEQQRPIAHWLGPVDQAANWEERFTLPEFSQMGRTPVEQQVLQIAEYGRTRPCQFDLMKSPFAAYLIRSLGFDKMVELRADADAFFEGELSNQQLLAKIPCLSPAFQLQRLFGKLYVVITRLEHCGEEA